MKKISLIILLPFFLIVQSRCQNISYLWHHGNDLPNYGTAEDAIPTPDNQLVVAYMHSAVFDVDPSRYDYLAGTTSNYLTIAKYDQQRNLVWAKSMDGSVPYNVRLLRDNSGNIYMYGKFSGSFDADPGTGTYTLTASGGSGNACLVKLDSTGQLIWAHALNGSMSEINSVQINSNGTLFIYGHFQGTMDVDPGASANNITASGTDLFILKWDAGKNYITHLKIGGSNSDYSKDIIIEDNLIYISGSIYDGVNFDPLGPGYTINSGGFWASFVAKYDTSFAFKKVVMWTTNINQVHIASSGRGNIIVGGKNNVSFDADPSAGTVMTSQPGFIYTAHIISLDTVLNYQWSFSLGGTSGSSSVNDLVETPDGEILVMGAFQQSFDFDPGAGSFVLASQTSADDIFIARYDENGQLVHAVKESSAYSKSSNNLRLGDGKRVFLPMNFRGTSDIDPGTGVMTYSSAGTNSKPLLIEFTICTPLYTNLNPVICKDTWYSLGGNSYNEPGVYRWIYNLPGGCDSIVTVDLSIQQPDTRYACVSDTISLIDSIGSVVQWFNCTDNSIVSGAAFPYYVPLDNDSYAAIITSGGCTDTTSCIQRLQASNPGTPVLEWGSTLEGAILGIDRPLVTDQYGNFYVAGLFSAAMDADLWSGTRVIKSTGASSDLFIAKYNSDGILQWAYPAGTAGTSNVTETASSLAVDDQGYVYAVGSYILDTDFDPEENNAVTMPAISAASGCCPTTMFILKLNPLGQLEWIKTIGGSGVWVDAHSIAIDHNGNIAVCGETSASSNVDFDPGPGVANLNGYAFIARYDSLGNYTGGIALPESTFGYTLATSVIFDGEGNLIATGNISSNTDFDPGLTDSILTASSSNMYTFIVKYDAGFNFLWAKRFGSHSGLIYRRTSLQTDCDNNIYLLGSHTSGSIDFSGGSGTPGSTFSFSGGYLVKYGEDGNFMMKYPFTIPNFPTRYFGFDLDLYGNAYISLQANGTITLEPGNTIATGGTKKLIAKYTSGVENAWAFLIADNASSYSSSIASDDQGNVFVQGIGTLTPFDIDPSASVFNLSTSYTYLAKYGTACSPINTSATVSSDTTTLSVTAGAYYVWKNCSDGTVADSGLSPLFSPATTGFYYAVIYMGTCVDSTGCYYLIPPPPGYSAQISSASLSICQGENASFFVTTSNMGPSPYYQWFVNGSAVSGETDSTFIAGGLTNGSTIFCSVTDSSGGVVTVYTDTLVLTVIPLPNTNVNASASVLTAVQGGAIYQWVDCNNNFAPIAGETAQTFTASSNGDFAVIITLNGCSDTSACINVNSIGLGEYPVAGKNNLELFPNPSGGKITLVTENYQSVLSIAIKNAIGQDAVFSRYDEKQLIHVDIEGKPGIYFIFTRFNDEQTIVKKVIKN